MKFRQMILDDVLENPEAFVDQAAQAEWGPLTDGNYPGRTSMAQYPRHEIEKIFSHLFPGWKCLPYSHRFRLAFDGQEKGNLIHCDFEADVSAVLYLTDNDQEIYTDFYERTGSYIDNYKELLETYPSKTKESLYKDFLEPKVYFQQTQRVKGVFNRLLIFDSSLFHAPSLARGSSFETGRLTQVFFLKENV